jgi:hypothetical protein
MRAMGSLVAPHFGHGVLTFTTGYMFRTSPGWALWARGSPNAFKDRIVPLEGVVETDWLPFPFTMNDELALHLNGRGPFRARRAVLLHHPGFDRCAPRQAPSSYFFDMSQLFR